MASTLASPTPGADALASALGVIGKWDGVVESDWKRRSRRLFETPGMAVPVSAQVTVTATFIPAA